MISIPNPIRTYREYSVLTDYQDAIAALNSLQTNFAIVEELRKSNKREDLNKLSIPEMVEWLRRIGHQVCAFPIQSDTQR